MHCPYCGNEQKKGCIYGDRGGLNFIADEEKKKSILFPKSIKIKGLLDGALIAYYCETCNKITIDLK
ncbi:MAG: PF20097 family protein [Clostridium sp.]|uniref:PF20097 family protein n=1 Tax=Clostridium TaxID=1485 RepID=UPI002330643F|nr:MULTISPECIES: PF20097 family protein [Clostridium]MDB1931703.1 PF20097 family protein [Clostridium tertium]MDB1938251.1 PF20097 family protein [Clostridium tertium]MDU1566446.1 PF20097 family protein [Clostridium sp.]MDU3548972.1 PF20097 family protein [Clostridium sp.]